MKERKMEERRISIAMNKTYIFWCLNESEVAGIANVLIVRRVMNANFISYSFMIEFILVSPMCMTCDEKVPVA